MRDIRIQPQFDDLVIATHGRDAWILDDLASLRSSVRRNKAGAMLFALRTAYEYHYHSNDLGIYTRFAGENPPKGAIVDFYQSAPQKIRRRFRFWTRKAACSAPSPARTK